MRGTLLGAALAMGMAQAAAAATVELVTNGGFESGDTGFSSTLVPGAPGSGFTYAIVTDPTGANSGSNYMDIDGGFFPTTDPLAWGQDVTLSLGEDYTFSTAIRSDTILGALSIRIGGIEIGTISSASPGWTTYSTVWTSTLAGIAALEIVQLSSAIGAFDYALDDISLTYETGIVPLPAALPLLLAGIGSLAIAGRRGTSGARRRLR